MPVEVVAQAEQSNAALLAAAIYEERSQAEAALSVLQQMGFNLYNISFLQRKGEALAELEAPSQTNLLTRPDDLALADNPVMGAAGGAAIGGVAGWMLGLAMVAIPGVGPFLALGSLGALATSAAVGAVAGGLAGALLLWGAPDDIAHHYATRLEGARCLLVVENRTPEQQELAASILERTGGSDIHTFTRAG